MLGDYYKPGAWNAICSKCGETKSLDCFYIHSNGQPRKQCKACRNAANRKYLKENPEKRHTPDRETANAATRRWRMRNKPYDAFRARTYRARKLQQLPVWADLEEIKAFYLNCPEGCHVDHIVPLKGKLVSGLHVRENLQYLPARENLSKRNIYHVG